MGRQIPSRGALVVHVHVHEHNNNTQIIPPLLRPLVRAYVLGYASSTLPRLLTLLVTYLSNRNRKQKDACPTSATATCPDAGQSNKHLLPSLIRILRGGLEWQRFPTFCAALVGGSTLLEFPLRRIFARLASSLSLAAQKRLTTWTATFVAAWFSIKLLQSKDSDPFIDRVPPNTYAANGRAIRSTKFAGRTMDLTLFAATRAVDVIIGELWARRKARRTAANTWSKAEAAISSLIDPSIFATSCAFIMWSFIYLPERLPRAYNKWISSAAAVDIRLLIALRRCQWGEIVYGRDTGQAPLLQSMCSDYNWPQIWGDPAKTIPFPCEMVHMGIGPSCELHAARRFLKGFIMAAGIYGPLNLASQLRNPSRANALRALISTARSSAFLGSFIALFYYAICLTRTRIGPHILGTDAKMCQRIDSGLCIGAGCSLCGWSILLENESRRQDIGLFVAPRALATLLPRRYQMKYQWRETVAFAASTAVVFTCVQENPARVRGVLGKMLAGVLAR